MATTNSSAAKDTELVLSVESVEKPDIGLTNESFTIEQPDPTRNSGWNNLNKPSGQWELSGVTFVQEKEYDEADGTLESRCEACRQATCVRWLSFSVLFVLDFAEFIFDWMFFIDVLTIRQGLVFGPPEKALIWTLLGLCLLGTAIFIVETVNTYRAEVKKKKWSLGYAPTLVDVWLVNIPSGIINVRMAACYETAISYAQLAKALAAMFLVLVKIINAIVGYCQELRLRRRYRRSGKKMSDFPRIVRLAILLGVITILVCSSFVLALTHLTTVRHGNNLFIKFRPPTSWEDVKVDTSKYFNDVSVYLQHPSFSEPCGRPTYSGGNHWMQLNSIYDVIKAEDQGLTVRFGHIKSDARNQYFYLAKIWPYQNKTTREHCYHRDLSTCHINELKCRPIGSIINKADNFTIHFLFERPSELVLVGNINFNGHARTNSTCTPFSANEKEMEKLIGKLHYFKNPRASENPLPFERDVTYFYSYVPAAAAAAVGGHAMRHVSEEWFTGMLHCKPRGLPGPTYSEDVTFRTCGHGWT